MIVVNPRNHWVKSAIFQDAVLGFSQLLVSVTFFLVLFSGDSTVESERSREVGLHKESLVF